MYLFFDTDTVFMVFILIIMLVIDFCVNLYHVSTLALSQVFKMIYSMRNEL